MNEGLKHRIIGILVLVALVVVFMPMLFDFDKRAVDTQTQIPPSPEIAPVEIAEPVRPEGIEAPKPDTEIFQPSEPSEQAAAAEVIAAEEAVPDVPAAPKLADSGLPESWVLQIGSFQEKQTASNLVQKLQKQGYKAYTQDFRSGGKTLHRVFVGPKLSKSQLLKEKAAIDKEYGVNSLVMEFSP